MSSEAGQNESATTGSSVVNHLLSPRTLDSVWLFAVTSTAVLAVVAHGLSRLQRFDGVLALLVSALILWWFWPHVRACLPSQESEAPASPRGETLGVWLAMAAVVLVVAPYMSLEYWFGRDQGVYYLMTRRIVETGGTHIQLPFLARMRIGYGYNVVRLYPGILPIQTGPDEFVEGQLMFQFNHITPAMRAVAVDLLGSRGHSAAASAFAVMAVGGVAMVVRRSTHGWWGLLAAMTLVFNAVFLYCGRSTLTEVPTAAFMLGAVWVGSLFPRDETPVPLSTLFVLLISLVLFSRVDGVLVLPFAATFLVFRVACAPPTLQSSMWMVAGLALGFLLSMLDLRTFSWPYFETLWRDFNVLGPLFYGGSGLLAATAGACVVASRSDGLREDGAPLRWVRVLAGLVGVLVVLALAVSVARFVSAGQVDLELASKAKGFEQVELFELRAARELVWYLPVPLLLAALVGASTVLARARDPWAVALVASAFTVLAVFAYKTTIYPDHPWAARRWLPLLLPSMIVLAGSAVPRAAKRWQVALAGALVVAGCGSTILVHVQACQSWMFRARKTEYLEGMRKLEEAGERANAAVLLTTDGPTASAFTYLMDRPAVMIRRPLLRFGTKMVRVPAPEEFCAAGVDFNVYGYDHRGLWMPPVELKPQCYHPRVYQVLPLEEGEPVTLGFGDRDARRVLLEGFATPEGWGTWTNAKTAKFIVPIHQEMAGRALTLRFDARAFTPKIWPKQTFVIFVGNKKVATWVFDDAVGRPNMTVNLPPEMSDGLDRLMFRVELPDARSPSDLGVSGDKRVLGLGLHHVEIWETGKPPGGKSDPS